MTDALEFEVTYNAAEYRSFVRDHAARAGYGRGAIGRVFLDAFATVVFAYKRRRVGTCSFRIDADGVLRRSKAGEMRLPWTRVAAVTRLSQCYLIELSRGALPIPYRCLDPEARSRLERIVRQGAGEGALRDPM